MIQSGFLLTEYLIDLLLIVVGIRGARGARGARRTYMDPFSILAQAIAYDLHLQLRSSVLNYGVDGRPTSGRNPSKLEPRT